MLEFQVNLSPRQVRQDPDATALAGAMAGAIAEAFGPEFELWTSERNLNNGRFDLVKAGRRMRSVAALNPTAREWLRPGDVVLVGFYNRDRNRPYIKADGPLGRQALEAPIVFLAGAWAQAEGGPQLDYLTHSQNSPIDYTAGSASEGRLGPANDAYPILGQVVFEPVSGSSLLAVLWQKQRGSQFGLELTALDFSTPTMAVAWTLPLGPAYSSLSLLEQELTHRNGYLIHEKSVRQLCAFGHGGSYFRQWAYVVSETGELVCSGNLGQRAHQCAFLLGKVLKCWHSSLRPGQTEDSLRETQDPLIRGYKRQLKKLTEAWNLDPRGLLPSCQISSSESHWGELDRKGFGRWPIDGSTRTMWVWVSGSERLPASGDNSLMQVLPNLSAHEFGSGSPHTYDYGRTKVQRAAIVGIDLDKGTLKSRLDLTNVASYLVDNDSIDWTESNETNPSGPTNGFQLYDWFGFFNVEYTYRGMAPQMGVALGPVATTIAPLSATALDPNPSVNEDEYCVYTGSRDISVENYLGQVFPGFGPDYEFHEPGGLRLFPLPMSPGQQASFTLPMNEAMRAKNPVGGCMAIDSGKYLFCVYAKTRPILSGRAGKTNTICSLEEFDWRVISPERWIPIAPEAQVPGGPTQYLVCAERQLYLKFGLYWTGLVEQSARTIVQLTGPGGADLGENDCSQYVAREHSAFDWPIVGQVYQILPIIEAGVFLLLRDRWMDYPVDQLPSVCVDVWAWGSGSTLVTTIELWPDRSTYYDAGLDQTLRKYDQYVDEVAHGKGADSAEGYWVTFQLRVHDREADTYHIERVRLLFNGSTTPSVTRWSTPDGGADYPNNAAQVGLQAIASDKSFNCPDVVAGTEWVLRAQNLS